MCLWRTNIPHGDFSLPSLLLRIFSFVLWSARYVAFSYGIYVCLLSNICSFVNFFLSFHLPLALSLCSHKITHCVVTLPVSPAICIDNTGLASVNKICCGADNAVVNTGWSNYCEAGIRRRVLDDRAGKENLCWSIVFASLYFVLQNVSSERDIKWRYFWEKSISTLYQRGRPCVVLPTP